MYVCVLVSQSCLTLYNPQTVACQASLSLEFSMQEYWSGLPFSSPGDIPDLETEIEPECPTLQADSLLSELPGNAKYIYIYINLNHFAIHLKLTQHCKLTILQQKIR